MATTSSTQTASKAATGKPRGNGKGNKGRLTGLVASSALALALLAGVAFSQGHGVAQSAAVPASGASAIVQAAPSRNSAILDGARPGFLEPQSGAADFLTVPGAAISDGIRPGFTAPSH